MVGVNVPIPVPGRVLLLRRLEGLAVRLTPSIYGPSGVDFYTRTKVVTSRWPDPVHVGRRPRLPPDAVTGAWTSASCCRRTRRRGAVVDLARQAENLGFSHAWTFDSHLLWEEPYVIYSQILSSTHRHGGRPDGDEPGDARLDRHRLALRHPQRDVRQPHVCGIGRATRRCGSRTAGRRRSPPCARPSASSEASPNGEEVTYNGSTLRFPWSAGSSLEVWVAAYGPKALALTGEVGDGFILQLADPDVTAWSIAAVRRAAEQAGRDPDEVTICVAAPAYVGDDLAHQREQCRWFGGMVGNHVADIVERYGSDGGAVPDALTSYIEGRRGYDYNEHGRAGNTHADFVPDEIVDRFCLLGPAASATSSG
jgi:probable F420-dependent oxidoreductase